MQDAAGQQLKIFGDEKDRPPEQNITLFVKHEKEFNEAFGMTDPK
jgi:hypothetical protein